ncbi:gliding motility-associated C-terminal domain-containing protein [Winogradskyella poriferorum]|uniref:gliding motility-associated C-terminal domain-containing protein n=1 Tax=Winogradskyella poriferorum TaxID=307627 RepID=UPI003D649447
MLNPKDKLKFACIFICVALFQEINAQLGFCQGSSGDPIFLENFGTGSSFSALPNGTTTYNFSASFPDDGFYTVSNGSFGNPFDWHEIEDHTPGDSDGKFLIVNAGFSAGEFYRTTVTGLCEMTTYEFSAWLFNLLEVPGFCINLGIEIPINVSFQIWDETDTNLLASGDTGDIFATAEPTWGEYGLVFQTLANQESVILKMINNGIGGCGNDLAIDDIEFKTCGDTVVVNDEFNNTSASICENEVPYSTELIALPDFSVFNDHFYQWQVSTDGTTWLDINGATNQTLDVIVSEASYYRTKVAEVAANLNNNQCVLYSDIFEFTFDPSPSPPSSDGDVQFNCDLNSATLVVSVPDNISVNWYTDLIGGTLLESNNIEYIIDFEGTVFAESVNIITGCVSLSRTPVSSFVNAPPDPIANEINFNCAQSAFEISVNTVPNTIVNWYDSFTDGTLLSSDSTTFTVTEEGVYYAEAVDLSSGCSSLNRVAFDLNRNTAIQNCIIPQGISPDVSPGLNDTFDLSAFGISQIEIYNRNGSLIYNNNNYTNQWKGQSNAGEDLPVGTYYYVVLFEGETEKRTGWVYLNK